MGGMHKVLTMAQPPPPLQITYLSLCFEQQDQMGKRPTRWLCQRHLAAHYYLEYVHETAIQVHTCVLKYVLFVLLSHRDLREKVKNVMMGNVKKREKNPETNGQPHWKWLFHTSWHNFISLPHYVNGCCIGEWETLGQVYNYYVQILSAQRKLVNGG